MKHYLLFILFCISLLHGGNLILNQESGIIKGTGFAKTHTFPIIVDSFRVQITDPDSAMTRTISVVVPVSKIRTGNMLRDWNMDHFLFEPDSFQDIRFQAETAAALKPGQDTLTGQFTINRVTRTQAIIVTLKENGTLHAVGTFQFSLTAFDLPLFGVEPLKLLDKVKISFDLTLPKSG